MPYYNFNCPFKHRYEAYQGLTKNFEYDGETPLCPEHFVEGTRMLNKPMLNGASPQSFKTDKSTEIQLGRKFSSVKEQEAFMKRKGIHLTDESDMKKISKNKKDVTQTKEYQESKRQLYSEINAAGGVENPDGTVSRIDENGRFKKEIR